MSARSRREGPRHEVHSGARKRHQSRRGRVGATNTGSCSDDPDTLTSVRLRTAARPPPEAVGDSWDRHRRLAFRGLVGLIRRSGNTPRSRHRVAETALLGASPECSQHARSRARPCSAI